MCITKYIEGRKPGKERVEGKAEKYDGEGTERKKTVGKKWTKINV